MKLIRLKVDVSWSPRIWCPLPRRVLHGQSPSSLSSRRILVAAGLVDSLARPGGKRHGFHHHWNRMGWETIGAAQEAVPHLPRVVAVLGIR